MTVGDPTDEGTDLGPQAREDLMADLHEQVEASVDDAARAFFDRVYGGWDVIGLDATVRIDGEVVATWRMEQSWIDAYLDGEMTREELAGKVEDSVERRDQP